MNTLYSKRTHFRSAKIIALFMFSGLIILKLNASAQRIDRRLKINLTQYNIAFIMPKRYVECDSGFSFFCGDWKITNGISYSIIKKDSSVKIALSFVRTPSGAEDNYLRTAVNRADTMHHKIIYYDSAFSKQTFNADHVVAITRNCTLPYKNLNNNRVFFIARNGRCHIELTYLYTDKMKKKIEPEIERTLKTILKFKD
ncbi:MAG: hypothetical protein J7539_18535 [Niabella sp.]|nr:hypothetical protein [Niabella sp.]